ncbi:MAG: O-antigen ligase family protein [Candidatus Promineifilaceae bacterium]
MSSKAKAPFEIAALAVLGAGVLLSSQFAAGPVAWLCLAIGLAGLAHFGRLPAPSPLDAPAALMLVAAGFGLWVEPTDAGRLQIERLLGGLGAAYGLLAWCRTPGRLRLTVIALAGLGAGLALAAPFAVDWRATQSKLIPDAVYAPFPLLISDAVHPNTLAAALALLLPLPIALWLGPPAGSQKAGRGRWLAAAAWLFMLTALVLTRSRAGYLAALLGLVAGLWLLGRRRPAAALLLLALGGVAAALLLPAVGPPVPAPLQQAVSSDTWAFRLATWRYGLTMLAAFPFTGVGPAQFNQVGERLFGLPVSNQLGAHSLYLQIGLDLGLPALFAFLSLVVLALWSGLRARGAFLSAERGQSAELVAAVAAGLLALLTHGLVDGTIWATRAEPLMFVCIGFLLAAGRQVADPQSET